MFATVEGRAGVSLDGAPVGAAVMDVDEGARIKLPVFGTVGLAVRASLSAVRRLWPLVLASTLVLFALTEALGVPPLTYTGSLTQKHDPWVVFFYRARPVAFILILIFLAFVTHVVVLQGRIGVDVKALVKAPGRLSGYIFDFFFALLPLVLTYPLFLLLGLGIGQFILPLLSPVHGRVALIPGIQGVIALYILAYYAVALGIVSRLALRLPSRALGSPIAWVDAWRLPRGNVLRLTAGHFLMSVLLIWPIAIVLLPPLLLTLVPVGPAGHSSSSPLSGLLISLANSLFLTVDAIGYSAFLSVAYAQLEEAGSMPERGASSPA